MTPQRQAKKTSETKQKATQARAFMITLAGTKLQAIARRKWTLRKMRESPPRKDSVGIITGSTLGPNSTDSAGGGASGSSRPPSTGSVN
jgi:hypothetical protein